MRIGKSPIKRRQRRPKRLRNEDTLALDLGLADCCPSRFLNEHFFKPTRNLVGLISKTRWNNSDGISAALFADGLESKPRENSVADVRWRQLGGELSWHPDTSIAAIGTQRS